MSRKKNVLIGILNWGLGHASRMIPVIQLYERDGWNVTVVSEGRALKFIRQELPQLATIDTQLPELSYHTSGYLWAHLLKLVPRLLSVIHHDRKWLETYIQKHSVDLILSDNRYGFRHPAVQSELYTHQLQLPYPPFYHWFAWPIQYLLMQQLNRFNAIRIVDDAQHSMAGHMSVPKGLKVDFSYTGPLSRFEPSNIQEPIYDICLIPTGLEPLRTRFLNQVLIFYSKQNKKIAVVGDFQNTHSDSNVIYLGLLTTAAMQEVILKSRLVISRSGYSTIMDLVQLNVPAVLIPTPGQAEQVYLAELHGKHRGTFIIRGLGEKFFQSKQEKFGIHNTS